MKPSIAGVWHLSAWLSANGQVPFVGDQPAANGVDNWLYGNSNELVAQTKPIQGLTLRINSDGSFTEERTEDLILPWFDREGVLDENVTPFSGVTKKEGEVSYLLLTSPVTWAIPTGAGRVGRIRYDDGDTIICDKLELLDRRLVRTTNVVTDELYLERVILIYER